MLARIKLWGEMAIALTAVSAAFSFLVSAFGGHLPPWATFAWAQTQEQIQRENAKQISQLNVLILSDKVAQIQTAVSQNPSDVNLRASLLYWQEQLQQAMTATLSRRDHK